MSVASTHAFRTLYEQRYAFVWGVLRRLGVPERDVEDLLQDVFVIVHRRLDEFEGRSAATTWLYAIAVRVYWNYARRQQRRPALASESASAMPILDDSVGPERFAEQREAAALLEQLLGGLDPDKRTAFVLAELEGLSAPEIAVVTGAKTRTIYSRIRAAKQQVEASAKRVVARERNDVSVRRLAREGTTRPPARLQRRAWVALLARLPGLSPASTVATWTTVTVVAVVAGLGLAGTWAVARPSPPEPHKVAQARLSEAPVVTASVKPPVVAYPPATAKPAAAPVRVPKKTTRPATPNTSEEFELLSRARVALKRQRPEHALRLLERHRAAYPESPLRRERERTRLLALCALDRVDEATALATRLALPRACE